MAEVILFHHAHGLTAGVQAFADRLRAVGHQVTVPDLYEGATFADLDAGVAHAQKLGMDAIIERGVAAAAALPDRVVYAGFSVGTLPAVKLAQTRPGAVAALLYHGGDVPVSAFGDSWPEGVALQVHVGEDDDDWVSLDEARALVGEVPGGELFIYPGISAHLFTDSSLDEYDAGLTDLVLERTLRLLSE